MSRLFLSPPPGWTLRVLGIALLLFLPAIILPVDAMGSANTTGTDPPDVTVLPTIRILSGNKVEVKVADGKNITFEPGEPTGTIYFGETCMDDVQKVTDQVKRKIDEVDKAIGDKSHTQKILEEMTENLAALGITAGAS